MVVERGVSLDAKTPTGRAAGTHSLPGPPLDAATPHRARAHSLPHSLPLHHALTPLCAPAPPINPKWRPPRSPLPAACSTPSSWTRRWMVRERRAAHVRVLCAWNGARAGCFGAGPPTSNGETPTQPPPRLPSSPSRPGRTPGLHGRRRRRHPRRLPRHGGVASPPALRAAAPPRGCCYPTRPPTLGRRRGRPTSLLLPRQVGTGCNAGTQPGGAAAVSGEAAVASARSRARCGRSARP